MRAFLQDHEAPGAVWQQGADGLYTDSGVILLTTEGRMILEQDAPPFRRHRRIEIATVFTASGQRKGMSE